MVPQKYDVVISGMGGIFPGCEDINDLESKLFNKKEMIEKLKAWSSELVDVPQFVGKLKHPFALDNNYFGIYKVLYNLTDPLTTQCLQYSFEAICDAGINPFDLNGSNTAVIMSSAVSETEFTIVMSTKVVGPGMVGQNRGMQANRISYFFNLNGPSIVIQDSWSGGMQALQEAHQLVSSGLCSAALVGAGNFIFGSEMSFHYQMMGRLNDDGKTKSFSADADGYTRSEGCVVFFLQRAEDAKRSYGTIVNVLTSNYGVRNTPFTDFCSEIYRDLLLRVYQEAHIDPSEVCYIEANGSASKKLDALELNSISEVMCKNRKTPLAVGSIKSNIGHTEAASGLMSIVKVLMAFKFGIIPPNIHYSSPNPDVSALITGQIKVVTEPTPLSGNVIGISSIGLSGSCGHVIIKQSSKIGSNLEQSSSNTPWLLLMSGRNEKLLETVIEKVEAMPFNENFIRLANGVFKSGIRGHFFRGCALLNTVVKQEYKIRQYNPGQKKPVWFLLSGMGSQWPGMGVDLMQLPIFAKAINHCHEVLLPKGINLLEIIHSTDPHIYDSILNSFVGIAAVQIGLVDVLRELGVEPDGIIGHSAGELGCAYADGCFTAEQTILCAYARGKASVEASLIKGMMAAVGLGYYQIKDQLPPTIEVACHNSNTSCTLAGPAEEMGKFVSEIKERGIFAKLVNVSNIAYHSRYIKPIAPILFKYLQQSISVPKLRTKRWISSSVPESSWDDDVAKYSSVEYHTNNLLNPVLFEEASTHIPANAVVIEIAPRGLLQAIVKKSLSTCTNIPLVNRFEKDILAHLFMSIGKLFLEGVNINVENLYPKREFPLSGPIPSLGPLLTWEKVTSSTMDAFIEKITSRQCAEYLDISNRQLEKFYGHNINGKQVIPFSFLLHIVIDKFKKFKESTTKTSILIENVTFKEKCVVSDNLCSELNLQIQRGTGRFEIVLNSRLIMFGQISYLETVNDLRLLAVENVLLPESLEEMSHNEVYNFFDEYCIKFNESFKLIQKVWLCDDEIYATIHWAGDWIEFLDAILMLVSLFETMKCNEFQIVQFIRQICLDTAHFEAFDFKEITVSYNRILQEVRCEGLKFHLFLTRRCNIKPSPQKLIKKCCKFLPYSGPDNKEHHSQISDCLQIIFQNILQYRDQPKKLTAVLFDGGVDIYNNLLTFGEQVHIITPPLEDKLDELFQNLRKTDNLLLIGELPLNNLALNCLEKVTIGFVLLKDNQATEKLDNLYPVFKFKFNNIKLTLYKMCHQIKADTLTIIEISSNNIHKWKSDLILTLKNVKNEGLENKYSQLIYLVGRMKSLFLMDEIRRYCLSLENSQVIRYFFMDDEAPFFSLEQPFYKEQVKKDLLLNIYVNHTWGCLNLSTPFTKSAPVQLESQPDSVYSISSIKAKNVTLKALGLNLWDPIESPKGKKLGVFDYCGVDKTGSVVCGIGTLSDNKELIEDGILQWKIPEDWSYEDIVTVPLFYSIAYYIFKKHSLSPVVKERILVHRGGLHVSQAIIRVALSEGYKVFTTYTTVEERNLILKLFPEISFSNIYFCKSNSFETPLLTKTGGNGVHIIVDTSDDMSTVAASLRCLTRRGFFFLLNSSVMHNENSIGMLRFSNEVIMQGVVSDVLLDLHPSIKEVIQKGLEIGIKEGHVKPLHSASLPQNAINLDAIDLLNTIEANNHKIVISIDDSSERESEKNNLFTFTGQKTEIILSDEHSFWLDLLNWMLRRGARNVYVLTELLNLVGLSLQRLLSILNKYPSANVNFFPKIHYKGAKTLLSKVNSQKEISSIFLLGKIPGENVQNLDIILKEININISLICIGSGGEAVCELRSINNIPALAISCDLQLLTAQIILPELDRLACNCSDDSVIIVSEDVRIENTKYDTLATRQNRLPDDMTELLALYKKLVPKACFVETVTKCAPYKYNREVDPIFVIPSLKPNEMNNLTSRLFYSTFEARLPLVVEDIDTIAKDLFEDMKRFNFNVFTIIANDWGAAVAFNLAKYLENDGKLVLLILLNSSPNSIQNWASAVLQLGDDNLIKKYIKLPFKMRQQLSQLPDWNEKVNFAVKSSVQKEPNRKEISNALNNLRKYLSSTIAYTVGDGLFHGKCIVYHTKDSAQDDTITQCCAVPPIINILDSSDHREMLEDPEFANKVNCHIPYDHKTAAREMEIDTLGIYPYKIIKAGTMPQENELK